jgi:hypothetical protein
MKEYKTVVVRFGLREYLYILTLIFVTLKLCKVIPWNWGWVLSPFLIMCGVSFLIGIGKGLVKAVENSDK